MSRRRPLREPCGLTLRPEGYGLATLVTKLSGDLGNTFASVMHWRCDALASEVVHGRACAIPQRLSATVVHGDRLVRTIRHQSEDGIQVDRALRCRWRRRSGGAVVAPRAQSPGHAPARR